MPAFLIPLLLKLSPLGNLLKAIPQQVWQALTILTYLFALIALHQHYSHEHDRALIAANDAKWQARLNAESAALTKTNAKIADMSAQLRKANDEANTRIAGDAGDLRLRGPGAAACPRLPGASAAPGQSQPSSGAGGSAATPLPSDDLAAVPWDWIVSTGEQADLNRQEVLSWRSWYSQLVAAWPKNTGAAAK
jgi:hypothetical protein